MKQLLIRLTRPTALSHWWQEVLVAIPRIACGWFLTTGFGSDKFGLPWSPEHLNLGFFEVVFWFPGDVAEYGGIFAMFPVFFAWMGAFSEAVGGLAWVLGFQTRIFSFLIACTMLVAIFLQKWGQPLWNLLPALSFLWVAIYGMIYGSNRLGLDYIISKLVSKKQ